MGEVDEYNGGLESPLRDVAEALAARITPALPQATGRLWHGHPVWLADGDPVAGYRAFPRWVTLLFWRGQEFAESAGLSATGSASMASLKLISPAEVEALPLDSWLGEAAALGGWTR